MNAQQQQAALDRRVTWTHVRFSAAFLILGIGIGSVLSAVLQ